MFFKDFLKYFLISCGFYLALSLVFFLSLGQNTGVLSDWGLLRFDALLYLRIKTNGYDGTWLCAFFPAFPYLWKLLNFPAGGMSVFNGVIFVVSISLICQLYKFQWKEQLFFLSVPSLMFMFVPYTEAVFFVAGTLIVLGFARKNILLLLIGLLLSSLTRPTTFTFIPAIILTYMLSTIDIKDIIKRSVLPCIILVIGLFFTIAIHYNFSGKWFVFFEAQKMWKNYLHVPVLPLTSWGGDALVHFDGSALFICMLCGVFLLKSLWDRIKKNKMLPEEVTFSFTYLICTALLILAYRDGNLYSLNRFIYATPFIVVALHYFFVNYTFNWKHAVIIFFISEAFWLLFASYNHIHNLLMFTTVSVYFVLLLMTRSPNKLLSAICFIALILINCYGMIKILNRFLNNVWVA